ncbi:MAG: cytochrome c [bacterium]|nr:cytochrome c [bacterium]MCP5065576.1 cytochrome c [bacterium]
MPSRTIAACLLALALASPERALAADPGPREIESVVSGKALYVQHCTTCHGIDGKALIDVIANATDLSDPTAYYSGTRPEQIFTSIRNGAGVAMPPWRSQLRDEEIQHLVSFILSLWPQGRE